MSQLEKQLAELNASERFILAILASLFTLALTVHTTRGSRAAVAVTILAVLALVAAERFPMSSGQVRTFDRGQYDVGRLVFTTKHRYPTY